MQSVKIAVQIRFELALLCPLFKTVVMPILVVGAQVLLPWHYTTRQYYTQGRIKWNGDERFVRPVKRVCGVSTGGGLDKLLCLLECHRVFNTTSNGDTSAIQDLIAEKLIHRIYKSIESSLEFFCRG